MFRSLDFGIYVNIKNYWFVPLFCRLSLIFYRTPIIIYELKPYNPQGVRNGIKQLERYKRLFELKTGATWDTFIDFY